MKVPIQGQLKPVVALTEIDNTCAICAPSTRTVKFREQRFDGTGEQEDRPLIVQFCGNDPDTVVRNQ